MPVLSRSIWFKLAGFVCLYGVFFYYQGYERALPDGTPPDLLLAAPSGSSGAGVYPESMPRGVSRGPVPVAAVTQVDVPEDPEYIPVSAGKTVRKKAAIAPYSPPRQRAVVLASYDAEQEVFGAQRDERGEVMQQAGAENVTRAFYSQSVGEAASSSSLPGETDVVVDTPQVWAETYPEQKPTLEEQYAFESQHRKKPGCPPFLTSSMINEHNHILLQSMGCNPTFTY